MPSNPQPAVLELIGNTPLVRVSRFDTGPCTLFLKLESQNPGGSIKDRVGLAMIDAAERDGRLRPGGTCWHSFARQSLPASGLSPGPALAGSGCPTVRPTPSGTSIVSNCHSRTNLTGKVKAHC